MFTKNLEDLSVYEMVDAIKDARNDLKDLVDRKRELRKSYELKRINVDKYGRKQAKEELAELETRLQNIRDAEETQWNTIDFLQSEINKKNEQQVASVKK